MGGWSFALRRRSTETVSATEANISGEKGETVPRELRAVARRGDLTHD